MTKEDLLPLVKASLGYSSTVRDELLKKIISGVWDELEENKGISLDLDNDEHVMFVVDLSVFRYSHQGAGDIPRNLEYRLRNLIIKYRGKADVG
ncbi:MULTISPECIES: hypothetical protein [unclassified Lactococcus]|uniref:hypothetical protein n=1 Tax=unclassified Lactococcus TaxID=2643510 RepID=UPI0011CB9BAF|nr:MULTISPECIES: hypothetical protein [unclassified Lactococcus]MQW22948.1 hypothetical protein [Lactococcus sp. dk101]TXK44505.1 hypothetical protein FVP42_04435 [Lactococcus sp. dk310]TXK50358.1 hypothetical protein FVP43_04405 [Lactococcus sp. dk322]